MTTTIRCEATAQKIGDRTIARLPEDASAALPSRGQVAVHAVVNGGETWIVLEPDGTKGHWLDLAEALTTSKALPGDSVTLELKPTKLWPEPDVPADLSSALDAAPDILETWNDITPMARWEWVRWVGATKNPDTREKRVGVTVSKLRSGKRRPCCFDLSSCTDPELAKNGKLVDA